ncbi:MFS transporter [Snodgrassella alvi]|uniref:MFS transporter n=1 Tax=Snodgrassella alvi TaxID=1196083 RepID=UPI001182E29D|nr:MFS transporter [Snodgrassella alvi]
MFTALAIAGLSVGLVVVLFINAKHAESKYISKSTLTIPSPLKIIEVREAVMAAGFLTVPQMAVLTFGGILHIGLTSISVILIGVQISGGMLRIWALSSIKICSFFYSNVLSKD